MATNIGYFAKAMFARRAKSVEHSRVFLRGVITAEEQVIATSGSWEWGRGNSFVRVSMRTPAVPGSLRRDGV